MKPCLPALIFLPIVALSMAAEQLTQPRDVAFTAAVDGTEQRYVEILPTNFDPTQDHHLLIALHGHGADRWQYIRETRGECVAARTAAARYDMIFVSPDYRAATSWMGPKAEADLLQIIAELRKQFRVGKVFLTGASMGGSAVFTFTALHPKLIAGVASQNPTANHLEYDNFQDAIAASFGGTKKELPGEYKKRSAELWAERLTMPVAIAVGGQDTIVPPASARRLALALQKLHRPVLLIDRETTGHSTSGEDTTASLEFVIRTALGLPKP